MYIYTQFSLLTNKLYSSIIARHAKIRPKDIENAKNTNVFGQMVGRPIQCVGMI